MTDTLSALARPLASVAQALWRPVRSVYRQRQAEQMPFDGGNDLLEQGLDETLNRLRGGNVDDTWWQNLLTRIGHEFVAPDFLRKPALQEWLADEEVQRDTKALARARVMGADTDDREARMRLRRAYALSTGELELLADGPIDVVLAILAAGYLGRIDSSLEPIAGMIQGSARESREAFGRVEEQLGDVQRRVEGFGPDPYVEQAHNEAAARELNLLCKQRSLSAERVHRELLSLAQRVTDGDLRHAKLAIRTDVYYWTARVHATQPETVTVAKQYLEQLHQASPDTDTRLIEALILETAGDIDGALRFLRDIDTPDGRATFFRTLFRARGEETALSWFDDQPERDHASFLTGIGWSNVALCLAQVGRWEEAADRLATAHVHIEEWPDLAFLEGVINAAILLPVEWRQYALEMQVFNQEMHTLEGAEADQRRARAKVCFEKAGTLLSDIGQDTRAQGAQYWLLWLRLTDPNPAVVREARREVDEGMKEGQKAVFLILFAQAFSIDFEDGPLRRYLSQRAQMGGLVGQELMADLLLAELRMPPREFAEYLEREEILFTQVAPESMLAGMRIEALAKDGQIVKARDILEAHGDTFVEYERQRLRALIVTHEGSDPRAELEALYHQTDDLLDLKNLINHLRDVRDWVALQLLLQELFGRERTLDNALQLISGMRQQPQPDYAAILTFLEANQDMVERNLDLASEQAWALSHVGRLKDAEAINRKLLERRNNSIDLWLDTNLALQSGDWERFPVIINRAWPIREALDPNLLMHLASFAAEADTTANRALDLVKLASGNAANNPKILLSAYRLGVQLGREDETGAEWLARAIELSSDEGPVWRVNVRTMAEEMLPKRREQARRIEHEWLRGKIPLHAAAHEFHQPLSRLLIDLPRKNADQPDGRRRTVVPIISGARQLVPIEPSWTVGFDVTSLMVLHYLGLLNKTIDALHRVVLAPDTMVQLLNERRSVRFHQPSLVRKAEAIRALIDRGDLKMAPSVPNSPAWLVDEVGRDLAELLAAARASGGRVVHPSPIHRLSTFGEVEAELREYAACLVSTSAFTAVLRTRGAIDGETHTRARQFLQAHDRDPNQEADPTLLDRPLYLDDLAVGYLQEAGVLQVACRRGLTIFVHSSTKDAQSALIEAHREGARLAETLDELRIVLRDAIESGRAAFLPRHHIPGEETGIGWLHKVAPALAQLFRDASACDAVCVDDRFFNRHTTFTDEGGHTVPMVCVLDLLQSLEDWNVINAQERQRALYKLRQAGYGLIQVPPDELEKYLRDAAIDQDGQVRESAEMRILRQTLMRIRSLDMVELPAEAGFLEKIQRGCLVVIRQLWADEALPAERAAMLSDWAWRHVAPSPLDWARNISEPLRPGDMPEAFARHLAWLLQPMRVNPERYEAFRNWVEEEVLAPLLPANADLVDRLVRMVRADIERLSEELSHGGSGADR
jgi:tetratricopeptide (TPR) repeat protein